MGKLYTWVIKKCCPLLLLLFVHKLAMGQDVTKAKRAAKVPTKPSVAIPPSLSKDNERAIKIKQYYQKAQHYRLGIGGEINYKSAFYYFEKAAALGDLQSEYCCAYMYFKGLGISQSYDMAAKFFAHGAYLGRDNSMYFYGLMFRNGFSVPQSSDSAKYWLERSAALGYKQAILELQSSFPESNGQAAKLVEKIHNAALPVTKSLNQFVLLEPAIDSSTITGDYKGYCIQYDWSGTHIVAAHRLELNLYSNNSQPVGGRWLEAGVDSIVIKASVKNDSLIFRNTSYQRKDHYSQDIGVKYNFENAILKVVRQNDSVYLAGNISMYSPIRKEPSKPVFIALVRTRAESDSTETGVAGVLRADISRGTTTMELLKVYPNPFASYLRIKLKVLISDKIGIILYNLAGQKVYEKPAELLQPGVYTFMLSPSIVLSTQVYMLQLCGLNYQKSIKVIKK